MNTFHIKICWPFKYYKKIKVVCGRSRTRRIERAWPKRNQRVNEALWCRFIGKQPPALNQGSRQFFPRLCFKLRQDDLVQYFFNLSNYSLTLRKRNCRCMMMGFVRVQDTLPTVSITQKQWNQNKTCLQKTCIVILKQSWASHKWFSKYRY